MTQDVVTIEPDESLKTWGWISYILHLVVAVGAVWLARRLTARFGGWGAWLLAAGIYVAVIAVVFVLLPNVAERRIIGARSLVSPVTGRHIFTWRQVARMLGADHRAIQRWHGAAIGRLVVILGAEEKYSRIA